jgi:hypothetical protein
MHCVMLALLLWIAVYIESAQVTQAKHAFINNWHTSFWVLLRACGVLQA